MKHYGHFTPYELDAAINPLTGEHGNYYCRHVSALTGENLHAKSEIAAELAWRDLQIDTLRATISRLKNELREIDIAIDDPESNLTKTQAECVLKMRRTISRLREYAGHHRLCHSYRWNAGEQKFRPCDCGYELIKEIGNDTQQ